MQDVHFGSDHPVAIHHAEKGEKENGFIVPAESKQSEKEQSSHKKAPGQHQVICYVNVILTQYLIPGADDHRFIYPASRVVKIRNLHYKPDSIGGRQGYSPGSPKRNG